jgi:hypothetical protein
VRGKGIGFASGMQCRNARMLWRGRRRAKGRPGLPPG